jgi:DNA-binding transcriptional ArsR family regulator
LTTWTTWTSQRPWLITLGSKSWPSVVAGRCRQISVNDIVAELNVAQPTVSHHLKILKSAGLVTSERQGKQMLYTLDQARLAAACCQVAGEFAPEFPIVVSA